MSDLKKDLIEENIVISWQWRFNDLHCRILDLAATLDTENLEKLRQGFPHHVSALKRFRGEAGWCGEIEARLRDVEFGRLGGRKEKIGGVA